jgi:glycerol-3-phosphate acyltransferase PlsY
MMGLLLVLLTFVVAFLLGSIPWGIVISRLFYHTDIREHGSGNIGTTNAIRTLGRRGGFTVFILDCGKGLLAGVGALLAVRYLIPLVDQMGVPYFLKQNILTVALLGCTLGHIFSPWLHFEGGKGIAVAAGCLFVVWGWPAGLVELGIFIVLVLLTRYVSVGSMAAALACSFIAIWLFWGDWLSVGFGVLTGLSVLWAHRGNMKRLLNGNEHRIGTGKAG